MVRRFFSLTVSELFLRGAKFLFFLILANFFNQNSIYEYGYFTAFFSLIFVFSDFGFQTYIIPLLSRIKRVKFFLEYVNISFYRLIFFIFLSLPVLIFYSFSQNKLYVYIFLIFFCDGVFAMYFAYLRSYENSKSEMNIKFFIGLIFLVSCILAYFIKSLHISFIFLCCSYVFYGIYRANYMRKKYVVYFIKSLNLSYLKTSVCKSLFIYLGALATMVYLRIDILMLDWLDSQKSVALYSIASRVLELSMVVPMAISAIILPKLTNSSKQNVKFALIKHFFIGIFVMLIFLFASNFLIQTLFNKYQEAILILNILLLSIPIVLVNNYIFSYFIAKNLSKNYALITSFIAILNIILNSIFIPKYSFIGASWATLFTEFLGMVLGIYFLLVKRRVS